MPVAGGPEDQPAQTASAFGISPELLKGIRYEDGAVLVPASRIQELLRQYVGDKASVELSEGSVRVHIADSADVWTTLTPSFAEGNGVRVAFSDTRWRWFIFGGRVKDGEARDRAHKEIRKKALPRKVDSDDVEDYRKKQAEIVKWRERVARLEALPDADAEDNAEKLQDLGKKIARMEQKLSGKDYAKVRAYLSPGEPTIAERIGRSMRPDGEGALRFDLPLPPGLQVADLAVSPEGLRFKIKGPAVAPASLPPAAPGMAPAWVPATPVAPRVPAPYPADPGAPLPGYCQPIGNIWKLDVSSIAAARSSAPARPAFAPPPAFVPAPPAWAPPPRPAGDTDGVAAMLARIPTGSGTALGMVPVTISREGSGIRFEAPVLGTVRITQVDRRWQVEKGGEAVGFVRRAAEGRDARGDVTFTLELESGARRLPPEPITITVADGGRTLRYGSYSVTMNAAAA